MATTVGDFLLRRLSSEWGVRRIYGYPGDGINGILGAFHERRGRARVHPGPPRGDRVVRGDRAREVHRRGRGLHGDLRPGRDPPAQRPLRRQARPPAGRRDRRPAGAHVARLRLPAGGRPRRRSTRTSPREFVQTLHGARAGAAPRRPRDADRQGHALAHVHHRPQRRPGARVLRGAAARARRGAVVERRRSAVRASCPSDDGPAPRPRRCSTPASGSRSSSARARRARRPRSSRSPTCSAPASAKALNGRAVLPDDLPWVTGSIGLLGHEAVLRPHGGLRHAAHGRDELPVLRVAAGAGQGARRCRSTSTPGSSARATRWRSTSSATPPRRCAR